MNTALVEPVAGSITVVLLIVITGGESSFSISEVISTLLGFGTTVLLFERQDGARLSELESPATVIVGPEGGFTTAEVRTASEAGVAIAGLGPRILRSRTVALAAAAVILSGTGDFA